MIGAKRKFDELGRIVILKEHRDYHDWRYGTEVEIINYEDGVFIKKV
jgi:bifunctional DNA-binding transcriptional regulator/antitoxin component of YhaV-PrlF toxin-antitoxin module